MKKNFKFKYTKILLAVVLLAAVLISFAPLNAKQAYANSAVLTDRAIQAEHTAFQSVNGGDRRSFLQDSYNYDTGTGEKRGEQLAAEYIMNRLQNFGYYTEESATAAGVSAQIILQPFSEVFTENATSIWTKPAEHTIWSQNVILRFSKADTDKRIIIGANIDNDYTETSDGALAGGSGVAVLLTFAQMLYSQDLPYNVDIVFFGAGLFNSKPYYIGSQHYCQKNSFGKIVLMLNVGRLGGETTFVYSDEVQTQLLDYATGLGDFKKLPNTLPQASQSDLGGPDNFPYAHYGMSGNHSKFMQRGIPVVNFFSGDYGGITLNDKEGSGNILKKDTIENMLAAYPNAYLKMADVGDALIKIARDGQLDSLVAQSEADRFDYSVFLHSWIAYLILAGMVLIGFVVLVFICRKLFAKYPPVRPQARPTSVFGEDYDIKH